MAAARAGAAAPGLRADVCVIDHESLKIELPEMIFDLPAGGRRIMQRATGYHSVVVAGEVTIRDDEDTGARPGRLVRGAR